MAHRYMKTTLQRKEESLPSHQANMPMRKAMLQGSLSQLTFLGLYEVSLCRFSRWSFFNYGLSLLIYFTPGAKEIHVMS